MNHNELRGEIVYRRTYSRPIDGTDNFEKWEDTIRRVIQHQRWLWERAKGSELSGTDILELEELRELLMSRKCSLSGRTLWLGGTDIAKKREASQFNCSGLRLESVNDLVDHIWLLMQGCGVGFHPEVGILNGFTSKCSIETIRSTRTTVGGHSENRETIKDGVWTITVGDSAEAWAKSFGKLLAGKHAVDKVVFDLSQIRPSGERLKGYGWISSGDTSLCIALENISAIMNKRAGQLLTRIDLLDVGNWMGTVLSSRRSAEIAFHRFGDPEWMEFSMAKTDCWKDNPQRMQSNNSLLFYSRPSQLEMRGIFDMMLASGGSEPGFINAAAAEKRAPWFKVLNPCAEILLGNKSFCNLCETNLSAFNGDSRGLLRAIHLIGRANYRQTCVNLRDGILQDQWHELNEFLRLTGVGMTGIVGWEHVDSPDNWKLLQSAAHLAVNSMAKELNLPPSKAVTTIKPSGTLSKVMGCTEGIHRPLGRYIFNHIIFSKHDPLVSKLIDANYHIMENPRDPESVIIRFPVEWTDVEFDSVEDAAHDRVLELNKDSAIKQLDLYKMVMQNYVDHNCSITVSYSPDEVPVIVDWLYNNWDTYVGVSWLLRDDPTKTAQDLGYDYLPQDVVTKEVFDKYVSTLNPVDLSDTGSYDEVQDGGECAGGTCPVK